MWVQTALFLVIIRLSEEICQKISEKTVKDVPFFYTQDYSYISCSNITLSSNLYSDIQSKMGDSSIDTIRIGNSSIPELRQIMFHNINIKHMKIESNVEIVERRAFENSNILYLTLDNNIINTIKDMSFNSSHIELLSLQNNTLSGITTYNFFGLSGLKKLNLEFNNITDIAENSFDSLTSLEELNLSHNKLVELHFGLFKTMASLESIYLNNNCLKGLSDNIFSQCKSLKYLNIENNDITIIDARHYPNSLISINASNNELTSVDFSNLINVDTIDLSFNHLTSILGWFYNLPSLKFLHLDHNYLGPSINFEALHHLKNLAAVYLDANGLTKINFKLFINLPILRGVSIAENRLTTLDFFGNDTIILTLLNLSRNSLTEVKNLCKIKDLEILDLSYNNLQEIKYDTFENMSSLKDLLLQNNSISVLHMGCFRDLLSLSELDLSYNLIVNVELGAFTGINNLGILDISHNRLSHLDENLLHNIKYLVKLNIAYNHLKDVDIRKMLSASFFREMRIPQMLPLREITLDGNDWTCSSLAELVKIHGFTKLTRGTSYNVTNVFGIACNNTAKADEQIHNSENMSLYLNSIEENTKQMSFKMTVNNVVLMALLILLCLKFSSVLVRCVSCFATAKQFVYERYRNEETNIQLT